MHRMKKKLGFPFLKELGKGGTKQDEVWHSGNTMIVVVELLV